MNQSENYTAAVPTTSEAGRIGIVTCTRCGAAVLLSMVEDSMKIHDEWHERMVFALRDTADLFTPYDIEDNRDEAKAVVADALTSLAARIEEGRG